MKFSDAITEVRNRVNIVDIIGQYVRLKRTGNNYMGLCPFHNEKTPSFSVSESRQIYKCFGCGKGGNVYNFLMEQDGMTFPEAVKYLASKVNVTIEDEYNQNNELTKKRDEMYKLYKDVANTYYKILYSDDGKKGLEYFKYRKLANETIKKFGLGFAPKSYGYVYKLMKEKGYDDKLLLESKLFGLSDNKPYDFFYDRVMFPLVDLKGNVVSFQGRILGDGNQKYINTAESLIYKKSRNLFGINYAKNTRKDFYILCEGNMDVITLHQAGFDNAVASWGTAFTMEQANLIKRKVRKVYLSQDTDAAGIKAIESSSKICEEAGIETYVLDYAPAKDVDEYINKYGKDEFQKKLDNPIPTFMFLISVLKKIYNLQNNYDYEKYINEIVSRLTKIDNKLIREKYIKDVAIQEKLELMELTKLVENHKYSNIMSNKSEESVSKKSEINSDGDKVEIAFVNLALNNMMYRNKLKEYVSVELIKNKYCKEIYEKYINGSDTNAILDSINAMDENEATEIKKILFSNDNTIDSNDESIKNMLCEIIKKIKINDIMQNTSNDLTKIIEQNEKMKIIDSEIYEF